jgi:DNA-binding winged helix-turn-helix (wHTH) protein
MPRYRFGVFVVSPAHRVVRRGREDVRLIPRYFDLLVLLLTHRHRAVSRQEIFDRVWNDVVVSDGALSQAIRTIRRSLGDDPREPRFIRTVARHGYQFVRPDVVEEPDEGPLPGERPAVGDVAQPTSGGPALDADRAAEDAAAGDPPPAGSAAAAEDVAPVGDAAPAFDPITGALDRLLRRPPFASAADEERREAAEQLHALGTADALHRLDRLPGHAEARAYLRDARWEVPGSGDVPLLASPTPWAAVAHLVRLRLRRAARQSSNRWAAAASAGAGAGLLAGIVGGVALWLVPESQAAPNVVVSLALVGAIAGALGAAGVGAGLAAAEALARSGRPLALTVCGAAGGALAGGLAHAITRAVLGAMFGRDVSGIGGWPEGLVLGAAAGLGYALSTSPLPGGGLAGPRGGARARTALTTGAACALAAVVLALVDRPLVAASLDAMAAVFEGSDVGLAPLARLLGEQELRPLTRTLVSAFEGLLFGAGVSFGLTHRPKI